MLQKLLKQFPVFAPTWGSSPKYPGRRRFLGVIASWIIAALAGIAISRLTDSKDQLSTWVVMGMTTACCGSLALMYLENIRRGLYEKLTAHVYEELKSQATLTSDFQSGRVLLSDIIEWESRLQQATKDFQSGWDIKRVYMFGVVAGGGYFGTRGAFFLYDILNALIP